MEFLEKCKMYLTPSTKGFTAILVGSIMAILIGSVMLIITYLVLSSIVTAIGGTLDNGPLNTSFYANLTVITQALTIVGVALIVAGVAGIIYMLMGVAGMSAPRGR